METINEENDNEQQGTSHEYTAAHKKIAMDELERSFKNVLSWFERNEYELNSYHGDCDIFSNESGEEKEEIVSWEGIKTPSIYSEIPAVTK